MLSRQRQLLTKLHKLLDAGLFAFAFWLAHAIRSIPVLDPNQLIKEFDAYAWLLLVIVPLTPPVLDMNRFYSRPVFYSRRETLYQLIRSGIWVSLVVITVLFVLKVEGARGVMLLFTPLAAGLCFLKEEVARRWTVARFGNKASRRRVILLGAFPAGKPGEETQKLEKSLTTGSLGEVEIIARLDINETSPNRPMPSSSPRGRRCSAPSSRRSKSVNWKAWTSGCSPTSSRPGFPAPVPTNCTGTRCWCSGPVPKPPGRPSPRPPWTSSAPRSCCCSCCRSWLSPRS
jgi:hypothetical protein